MSAQQLRIELKSYRYKQSKLIDKPAYVVYSNKDMENIIDAHPTTTRALQRIKGFGPKKVSSYGKAIVALVSKHGAGPGTGNTTASSSSRSLKRSSTSSTSSSSVRTGVRITPKSSPQTSKEKIILTEQLTADQLAIATRVLQGESIFLTGPAGSGKSFLFRYIIQELKKKYHSSGDQALAITAPTGIAAINVNGQTIHSWAGVGLGRGDADKLYAKVEKSDKVFSRWANCKTLLIDEVSMLPDDLFQKVRDTILVYSKECIKRFIL